MSHTQVWVSVVGRELTLLRHSRDFSGPPAVRGVEVIHFLTRTFRILIPSTLGGLQGQEGGDGTLEATACPVSPVWLTPFPPSWAQGPRPSASLDNESSSTKTMNMLTLCLRYVCPSSLPHPPPSCPAHSPSPSGIQTGIISPVWLGAAA